MRPECDVVVLGGGPAGAAAAISLARAGRSVILLERSDYNRSRIGETLPPTARVVLSRLGVWDRFLQAGHTPSPGTCSDWGADGWFEQHFIFNPYGHGWHLDRQRFDAMLAAAASQAGADVRCGVRRWSCEADDLNAGSYSWRVVFGDAPEVHHVRTHWVVDATGRTATFARKQGANRVCSDRLVSLSVIVPSQWVSEHADRRTLVEAAEGGWWYSALLPGSRLMTMFMTDADLLPRQRQSWFPFWRARMQATRLTQEQLRAMPSADCCCARVFAANGSRLDRISGDHWVATGDAASAFDPLSAQGVLHGLTSGLSAAEAVDESLGGEGPALLDYQQRMLRTFREYEHLHADYYGRERRWPRSMFWHRRHRGPGSRSPG